MSFSNEGRLSDSLYIESVWRGQAGVDCFPNCPAESRWHLLLLKEKGKIEASIAGPMTKATTKSHAEGVEWLVVKFALGTFMPHFPSKNIVDGKVNMAAINTQKFWLNQSAWQFPDYENVEIFVKWLVHDELLFFDPIVKASLEGQLPKIPLRTLRHHFLNVTGLSQREIRQIERAQYAMSLLEQGQSILDVVFDMGYADQAHLTRSLKQLMGQTPAQILRMSKPQ